MATLRVATYARCSTAMQRSTGCVRQQELLGKLLRQCGRTVQITSFTDAARKEVSYS
jgi:hypothetical protein